MDQCHPRDPGGAWLTIIEGAGHDGPAVFLGTPR